MSDAYQEIEATLTEMESCMMLLLPGFDLTDVKEKVSGRSTPISKPANEDEEQPCCSKDLRDGRKEEPTESKTGNPTHGEEAEREATDEEKTRKEKHGDGENEKKQKEDEESSEEEEPPDEDLFIRNSGLISHAYSLHLNLSTGKDWSL